MPQGIDDFAIALPELTDIPTFGLEPYNGLDRLWRMVERYKDDGSSRNQGDR
jgi:hypothetical protein